MEKEPKSPEDKQLKAVIDDLAEKVAKYGKTFEKLVKESNAKQNQYDLSFLKQGKEYNDYYKYKVILNLASINK